MTLEHSTPWPWRRTRLLHVFALTTLLAGVLALCWTRAAEPYAVAAIVRNCLGCLGLVSMSAYAVGAPRAWVPTLGCVATAYLAAPDDVRGSAQLWAWPVAPSTGGLSTVACLLLFAAGTGAYAFGSRHSGGAAR